MVVHFDKIIELLNLNKQFLFLKNSLGKFKAEEAAISAENMNKEVKISQTKSETNVHFKKESYGDLSLKITITNKEKITPSCTIR